MSWVVKWTIFYVFCLVCTEQEFFTTCVALYFKQWQQSLKIRRRMKYLLNQVKYLFYMLVIVNLFQFFQLKNMLWSNLNKICVCILTLLLAFPISVLLRSSNFTSGQISSDFIWEERELKKLSIQVESLASFFGLPFRAAFNLSILLPIIPFWSVGLSGKFRIFQHAQSSCWMVMCQ